MLCSCNLWFQRLMFLYCNNFFNLQNLLWLHLLLCFFSGLCMTNIPLIMWCWWCCSCCNKLSWWRIATSVAHFMDFVSIDVLFFLFYWNFCWNLLFRLCHCLFIHGFFLNSRYALSFLHSWLHLHCVHQIRFC